MISQSLSTRGVFDMNVQTHWERVYGEKPPNAVRWYTPHLARSLEIIERASPSHSASINDVGGGESTLVDDLLAHGYQRMIVTRNGPTARYPHPCHADCSDPVRRTGAWFRARMATPFQERSPCQTASYPRFRRASTGKAPCSALSSWRLTTSGAALANQAKRLSSRLLILLMLNAATLTKSPSSFVVSAEAILTV
jgi:hypothetical protein